jgi:DNA-binding LytR/AlgR family response regulator
VNHTGGVKLKVTVDVSPDNFETEIIIKCQQIDNDLQRLMSLLKNFDEKILGVLDGSTHFVDVKDIFYFESVDKKTFIYTKSDVLETPLRLYEIEEKLSRQDFFRASKSTVINVSKIKELSPRFNGRLDALLENNEKLVISRQYVPVIKEILGL